jgi:cytochrome c2
MAFAGVAEPEDLANLLVYLRSLAEEPVPLPEAAAAEAQAAAGTEAEPAAEAEAQQAAGTEAEPVAAAETQQAASAEAEPGAEAAAAQEGAEAESPQAEASTAQAPDPDELVAAVEEAAPEQAAPEQATPAADAGVGVLLAQADVDAGAKSARKCAACHSFEEGGANKIGPPLWGVIGRDVAALDFAYSDALSEKEGAWDYQALDAFLAEPREWAPGTKMAFAGIREPEERADVILYLRSLSNEPAPLP